MLIFYHVTINLMLVINYNLQIQRLIMFACAGILFAHNNFTKWFTPVEVKVDYYIMVNVRLPAATTLVSSYSVSVLIESVSNASAFAHL